MTIIENQRAEKKSLQDLFLSHYLFFDGQLTLGAGLYGEGGAAAAVVVVEFVCACQL